MALIICPECGNKISSFAQACPYCGMPMEMIKQIIEEKPEGGPTGPGSDHTGHNGSRSSLPEKVVHCIICDTEFNRAEHSNCPNCRYPALTFCNKTPRMDEFVNNYRREAGIQILKLLQAGQHYKMGRYGGEAINWRVLAVEDGKALLISEKGLDVKPYHKVWSSITWAESTLQRWLNTEFVAEAFTEVERIRIANSKVCAHKNPNYPTDPGRDTDDQVFLLSILETEKYFSNEDDRKAVPTEYARGNGAYVDVITDCCKWWLRTPGFVNGFAAQVNSDGSVHYIGAGVSTGTGCVRPALWINLED